MTTFTSADLLDSLMRTALQPQMFTTTDSNGNAVVQSRPGPLDSIIGTVMDMMRQPEFRDQITAAVLERIDVIADGIAAKLPDTVIYRKQVGSYPPSYRDDVTEWLAGPITVALNEALKPKVAEYVAERFPVLDIDRMRVTINVEVVQS